MGRVPEIKIDWLEVYASNKYCPYEMTDIGIVLYLMLTVTGVYSLLTQ